MSKLSAQKAERLAEANRVIHAISNHGRQFFRHEGRVAHLELRRGRVYIVDDYTQKAVYTHETTFSNRWHGFSHGGTLRHLVELMRDYVTKGEQIHPDYIGLKRAWSDGYIWGYTAEAVAAVRAEIGASPMFFEVEPEQVAA